MSRKFTVESSGMIPGVGISGPVTTPIVIQPNDVLKMVKSGMVVYEHNPYNIAERVKVTPTNINFISFDMAKGIIESKQNEEAVKRARVSVLHRIEPKKEETNQPVTNKNKNPKEEKVNKPDNFEKN